jgi:hypothetical protein
MGMNIGSTSIGGLYLGSTEVTSAYLGSTKVYEKAPPVPTPTLPAYTVRLELIPGATLSPDYGTATRVSSDPNIWDWHYENTDWSNGLAYNGSIRRVIEVNGTGVLNTYQLFYGGSGLQEVGPVFLPNCTNMDGMFQESSNLYSVSGIYGTENVVSMSTMFGNCGTLHEVPLFDTKRVGVCDAAFYNCVNVVSGALAMYQQLSTQTTPPYYYADCFLSCGSNTTAGAAELAQIPSSWGGTGT